jgi:ribosomal protein S18 acetylase RimI-like enzyme
VIRSAEPADAEAVLALMAGLGRPNVAHDPAEQTEVFHAQLEDLDSEVFVAELDGTVAGAVSLVFRPRLNWTTLEAWIPDLYVDPGFRRRGAARALLDACVEAAQKRGCHRLILESGHERAEAHQLYEAYGFVHTGRAYGLAL